MAGKMKGRIVRIQREKEDDIGKVFFRCLKEEKVKVEQLKGVQSPSKFLLIWFFLFSLPD